MEMGGGDWMMLMTNQHTKIPFSTLSVMIVERIFSGFSMLRLAQIDDPYVTDMDDISPQGTYSWSGNGHGVYRTQHLHKHGAGRLYSHDFNEDPFSDYEDGGPDGKGNGAGTEYDRIQYDLY